MWPLSADINIFTKHIFKSLIPPLSKQKKLFDCNKRMFSAAIIFLIFCHVRFQCSYDKEEKLLTSYVKIFFLQAVPEMFRTYIQVATQRYVCDDPLLSALKFLAPVSLSIPHLNADIHTYKCTYAHTYTHAHIHYNTYIKYIYYIHTLHNTLHT
jgi:hypothetical protein